MGQCVSVYSIYECVQSPFKCYTVYFNVDPKCGTCAPKKDPPFDLKKKRESLWGCVRKNICQIKHVQLNFIYVAPNNSKATCRATPCGGG